MLLTLETDRLLLRPFKKEDAESVFNNYASDDEVTKYVTWCTHQNIEVTKSLLDFWIKQYEKEERINFAIELKENGELIGGIDVVGYLEGVPVIGYVIARKYWGKGIATEATKKVIELLFSLNHKEIIIDAMEENIGSNKVIIKCNGVYQNTYDDECKGKTVKINRYVVKKES